MWSCAGDDAHAYVYNYVHTGVFPATCAVCVCVLSSDDRICTCTNLPSHYTKLPLLHNYYC